MAKDLQCEYRVVTPPGMPNVCVIGRHGGRVTDGMCKRCVAQGLNTLCLAGTELKRLLAGFPLYIKTLPGCKCNQRAKHMDAMGCDWCEQNIDTIVGWLKEEHENRKIPLPFSETLAALLVKRAIAKARKANSK